MVENEAYKAVKDVILDRIKTRQDFQSIDVNDVERIAKLYADWLYVESLIGTSPEEIRKHTLALREIDIMLNENLDRLGIGFKMRRRLASDLQGEGDLAKLIKKLYEKDKEVK